MLLHGRFRLGPALRRWGAINAAAKFGKAPAADPGKSTQVILPAARPHATGLSPKHRRKTTLVVIDDASHSINGGPHDFRYFSNVVGTAISLSKKDSTTKIRAALDCEGVNLGRYGTIELVSL